MKRRNFSIMQYVEYLFAEVTLLLLATRGPSASLGWSTKSAQHHGINRSESLIIVACESDYAEEQDLETVMKPWVQLMRR